MRGGTSRGPFFLASDLPSDVAERDRVLLAVMGSPDARQIDGLGGADPLTSKVGIVSRSSRDGVDLDFLFAQVLIHDARVDTTPNCGNMLAAVVPFALETGLLSATGHIAKFRVHTVNTGTLADISVAVENGKPAYDGDAKIDGVPGTASPVNISFLDTEGSVCGSLLPTGNRIDQFEGVDVTCIDNGMPVIILRASDVGVSGYESRDALNANTALKARIESIRVQAGAAMNLGDVRKKVVPKVTLVAPASAGGSLSTRTFIPHDCHASIGVLGAVSVATAAVLEGTVAHRVCAPAAASDDHRRSISVEHPTGEFTVNFTLDPNDRSRVVSAELLRTARLIMRGEVYVQL
jgi:4-oxalomesaconate tautomerase